MQQALERHVHSTYYALRLGIAVVAIAFPLLLSIGGQLWAGIGLQRSMSAYYHAENLGRSMRDWFVGVLFAVGVSLYLYKGYSAKENAALNLAGVAALGVALFPTATHGATAAAVLSLHGAFAITFFLAIAYVCLFCAKHTLKVLGDEHARRRFELAYRGFGIAMIAAPASAYVLTVHFSHAFVFWVELAGILVFSAYWLVKSRELALSEAEAKALRGQLAL